MTKFVSSRRRGQDDKAWQVRPCSLAVLLPKPYRPDRPSRRLTQFWAVVVVFSLNSLNVAINLLRMINSNSKHFDDRAYKDAYRRRIVVPLSWFFGLAVIVLVQLLVLHRLYDFSRRLSPRLSTKKKLAFSALLCFDLATAVVGALSYALYVPPPRFRQTLAAS